MNARDPAGSAPVADPSFIRHRPAGALAAHVDSIWFSARPALAHSRERSLPTGRVDIVIPLLQASVVRFDSIDSSRPIHHRGAVVSGAHDRFAVRGMGGASRVIGVHFKPGGAAAFFGAALPDLRNRTVLLEALWGPAARDLRERLQGAWHGPEAIRIVEGALLARLAAAPAGDAVVTEALRALARDPSAARIDAVRRASGCSPQQFIRRFEAGVGITPKRYARVLRFSGLLRRANRGGPRDWAGLAAECGYFDQSHLIHEFRALTGLTPGAYAPVAAEMPTHVALAEAAAPSPPKNLQSPARPDR
jgi:AraC-like DNA-binding protein